ncbi:hypothetical protein GCM10017608_22310 [Agromyces luteolus]|uniref:HAD-IA family hydrolase n=1 Tax=Agromyces luteolus TaxID=88373 RepID=A0A7C9MFJ7_9MICO|nr:HAD-IA family hydrolase [Agromyces luteolus]MUN05978.1 HAD-IA family hydrolase [Agromyces luteolus]GLK28297.1 hypothetical protein GCM10017608_22310 [Agromyces luteolus]
MSAAHRPTTVVDAEIVSFDVFDTLLDRVFLRPTDVFTLTRHRVNAGGEFWLDAGWTDARIAAEAACYATPSIGPDITIDDIYDRLESTLGMTPELRAAVQAEEIATELSVLAPTRRGRELFDAARAAGARILIVSDMYLPPDAIAEALTAGGYSGWDRLVVSGYDRIAKHDGTAFRKLRAEFPAERILHVGDNVVSDVEMARRAGLEALHLPGGAELCRTVGSAHPSEAIGRIAANERHTHTEYGWSLIAGLTSRNRDRHDDDAAAELGYAVLGPVLVGFTQWLHAAARARGIDRLAFLAREGKLLRDAYRELLGDDALRSDYVYASRRMVNLAGIRTPIRPSELDFLAATGAPLRVAEYVTRFIPDIAPDRIDAAARSVGLRAGSVVAPEEGSRMRQVFRALEPEIVAAAGRERGPVIDYLRSVGLHRPTTAVVDVGWQGSIQASLRAILNPDLEGFYFGIHPTPKTVGADWLHGFVDGRQEAAAEWHRECILPGIEVVELLFGNPVDASVATVRRDEDGGFAPVFGDERMRDADGALIATAQRAAMRFVRDFREASSLMPAAVSQLPLDVALAFLGELVLLPTAEQARLLGGLMHDNSLGVTASPLALPRHGRRYYRLHPMAMERELDRAWWKAGFRKNVESGHAARR